MVENPRGGARECEGEMSRRRALTPPEWTSFPGGTKTLEWPPMVRECQGEGEDGRIGDGTPPITRTTEESGAGSGNKDMARGPRIVAPPRPQHQTASGKDSTGPQRQQSHGANVARP